MSSGKKASPVPGLVRRIEIEFDLFCDRRGRGFAARDGRTWRIPSEEFTLDVLIPTFRALAPDALLTKDAASTVGTNLLSIARTGEEREVFRRLGWERGGAVLYLDLGTRSYECARISADGWQTLPHSPVPSIRHDGMAALPVPLEHGDVGLLRQILHVDDRQFVPLAGWLVGALNPFGPHPILNLVGEAGSGKSVAARMLQGLLDPSDAALLRLPEDARSFAVMVDPLRVATFDNVGVVLDWLSNLLCLRVSGGVHVERRLYTDRGREPFDLEGPTIMTSLVPIARNPDLADRIVVVEFAPLPEEERRDERDLLAEYERVRPAILGGLLDAVSTALANLVGVHLQHPSRLADHVRWVEAAAPALGWEPGLYAEIFNRSRSDAAVDAGEGSPLWALLRPIADAGYEGTAAELLAKLREDSEGAFTGRKWWPDTPDALGRALVRLAPNLRKLGYLLERERVGHDRHRLIRLYRTDDARPPAGVVALPLGTAAQAVPPAPDAGRVEEVASALRACGFEGWPAWRVATLALKKSSGDRGLAARALEAIGVPAPGGGSWTADAVSGVL